MIIMSNTKKRVIDNEPFVNGYINKQFQSPRHNTSQLFGYQIVARYFLFVVVGIKRPLGRSFVRPYVENQLLSIIVFVDFWGWVLPFYRKSLDGSCCLVF